MTTKPGISMLAKPSVAQYMRPGIVSCAPDASLREVALAMSSNKVHAIFVVNDRAAEPQVILDSDLVAAASSGHFDHLGARDVASAEAKSVFADDRLERAVELLGEGGVGHLVVRDRQRMPVGVISTLDVARAIADESPEENPR